VSDEKLRTPKSDPDAPGAPEHAKTESLPAVPASEPVDAEDWDNLPDEIPDQPRKSVVALEDDSDADSDDYEVTIQGDEVELRSDAATDPLEPWVIEMDQFSGPLDLLLHLIKKHEMDIFDIQIALITEKYLKYVDVIRELNLERAGDFLLMAATLAHIKSRMLLPVSPEDEEDEEDESDPREELVRRLLEYQKYKGAAEQLASRPILGRDVFVRPPEKIAAPNSDEVDVEDVSVFQLIELFQELLDQAKKHAPHKVQLDTVSVDDKIVYVLRILKGSPRVTFRSLFINIYTRPELVATFLAILELARLRALRIYQTSDKGEIYMSYRPDAPSDEEIQARVDVFKADGPEEPDAETQTEN
jgi:segregation and condensation protein A